MSTHVAAGRLTRDRSGGEEKAVAGGPRHVRTPRAAPFRYKRRPAEGPWIRPPPSWR